MPRGAGLDRGNKRRPEHVEQTVPQESSTLVFDADEASFDAAVLQRSFDAPVVVDFWAEWCGPCRVLGPVLERLAVEDDGAWVLARVDVDSNPNLAAAFRIQGIPAVHAFHEGRPVSQFVGALPEHQVRAWLAQLGPSAGDVALSDGIEAEAAGDLSRAADAYRRALLEEPGNGRARLALERVDLALRSAGLDESALRERVADDPRDVDATLGLADLAASRGGLEEAFDLLLDLIRATSGDERDRSRRHLLKLLDTVPPDDPRAVAARRSLSLALF
jgi:putative thioredoxin